MSRRAADLVAAAVLVGGAAVAEAVAVTGPRSRGRVRSDAALGFLNSIIAKIFYYLLDRMA